MTELNTIRERLGSPGEFVANVRRKLALHGIPQARLAERLGVPPSNLSRWLRGRVRPSLETMLRIEVAVDRLIYGAEARR